MAPSPRKRRQEDAPVKSEENASEIRYGALEVLSVYQGAGEGDDDKEYGFVQLQNDILFGDTDMDEMVQVEWLEAAPENGRFYPDEEDTVAIGALICAVTADVMEHTDGSFEIPDSVRQTVEQKLEWQLSDDYDPTAKNQNDDEATYEARMKKKTRRDVKVTQPSKSKAKGGKKKGKRTAGGGASGRGRGRLTPRPQVKLTKDIFTIKNNKASTFSGDTNRASKEVIRAVKSGLVALLKKLIKDKKNVADLFVCQSCDVPFSALGCAFVQQDKAALELLLEEKDKPSTSRASLPECSVIQRTSGRHTSRYADYNRHNIGASRGGKEGDNAFIKDTANGTYQKGQPKLQDMEHLSKLFTEFDPPALGFLEYAEKKVFDSNLYQWSFPLYDLLKAGHYEWAQVSMRAMLARGVGLNQLHVDVLGPGGVLEKFRGVSVIKKSSTNGARFCPIHCAAVNPNPTYLEQLLNEAPEAISTLDSQEAGLLHFAAVGERPDTLKWLLQGLGAKISRTAKTRRPKETAVMWAARAARPLNIRLLCEGLSGEELSIIHNSFNADGVTTLHVATAIFRAERFDTVKALVECGAKVDVRADARLMNKVTPSMIAVMRGDLEMIEILVECGADLTAKDKLDRTLAMFAAMNGHAHVLSYLIRAGVDVNAQDSSENAAIHYAAAYGWHECMELLLEHEANPDPRNSWSSTPLSLSLKKGCYACAAILLKLTDRVDVNVCDKTGRSIFSSLVGAYLSQLEETPDAPTPWAIKQILLRDDLDISLPDSSKRSVLHYIASSPVSNHKVVHDLVEDLLRRGLDPLPADEDGAVPASLALQSPDLKLAQLLFKHVPHTNVDFKNGTTLLHLLLDKLPAIEDAALFRQVLELMDDSWVSVVDGSGRTPILVAADALRQLPPSKDDGADVEKGISFGDSDADSEVDSETGIEEETEEEEKSGGLLNNSSTTHPLLEQLFEIVLDSMTSSAGDTLQRREEFRSWKNVEKRLKANNGVVDWSPYDEYNNTRSVTVFHSLCSLDDTPWVLRKCRKVISIIEDTNRVKELINTKSSKGETPVSILFEKIGKLGTFSKTIREEKARPMLQLLHLLNKAGANMNGVPHTLFASLECALDQSSMDVALDVASGSDEEKLVRVFDFAKERARKLVRNQLADKDKRMQLNDKLRPYIHTLVLSEPPVDLFKEIINLGWLDTGAPDLSCSTPLHLTIERGLLDHAAALIDHGENANSLNAKGDSPLTLAAENGHEKIVGMLLNVAEIDYICPRWGTALHAAVQKKHSSVIKMLLDAKCSLNLRDGQQRTPLHYAIGLSSASTEQVLEPAEGLLLAAGADINAEDAYGRTPPFYAFAELSSDMKCNFPHYMGKRDPVDMLSWLSATESVNLAVTDHDKRSLLHLAASAGASICVLSLAESNPNLMHVMDADENTPLAVSLLAKRWDTSLLLISKGSTLDVEVTSVQRTRENGEVVEKSRSKKSTLWHALQGGGALATYMLSSDRLPMDTVLTAMFHSGRFQKALQHIRQCRDKDLLCFRGKRDGMTALHRLAQSPSFSNAPGFAGALVDALVNNGAPVQDASAQDGWSVAHVAAFHGHSGLLRHMISAHGLSVDVTDKAGQTPLASMLIGSSASEGVTCVVLEASRDPRKLANSRLPGKRNHSKAKQIHSRLDPESRLFHTESSARRAKEEYVRRLAEQTNNKNPAPSDKYVVSSTVLTEATRFNRMKIAHLLLSHGADISAQDEEGRTALHHAVLSGNVPMLSLLLQRPGTAIDTVDNDGKSALAYSLLDSMDANSPGAAFKLLLDRVASPQIGCALELAVRHNLLPLVKPMLFCAKTKLKESKKPGKSKIKAGDDVWVRFGGISGSWRMALIVDVNDSALSIRFDERASSDIEVPLNWVCTVDASNDVPVPVVDALLECFKPESVIAKGDRRSFLEQREGAGVALLEHFDTSIPAVQALLSPLEVGDMVGRFQIHGSVKVLQIASVTASYANGLYDVMSLSGIEYKNQKRTSLRALREDLLIPSENSNAIINPAIVHACVNPFGFGSYENLEMLQAIKDAGVELEAMNEGGQTPLDLARPGSEVQKFLREVTKKPTGGREAKVAMSSLPSLDGVDLESNAKEALHDLLQAKDTTELVKPEVKPVHELESDGVYVLEDGEEDFYDVALTKVDVEHGRYGKYVFYKMQVVVDPVQNIYMLLTNWGRIGEGGKFQQTPFSSVEASIKEFNKVFKSKTGNTWVDRETFNKKPGKYSLVRTTRRRVKHPEKLLGAAVGLSPITCSLQPSLAETFRALLDTDMLTNAAGCFGLDQSRLPLGQLTMDAIDAAEEKLKELKHLLDAPNMSDDITVLRAELERVAKLSSEFYELLPAGDQVVAPFQDASDRRFQKAFELIRVLRELTVPKQLLLGAWHHQAQINPIDYAYKALQVQIEPVQLGSLERKCVQRFIDSTCSDDILVNQIYSLDNGKRIVEFENKRLLFHGSGNANILGILSQGLRIAPPEAPESGKLYGKGVYFSDSFSKAFGYANSLASRDDIQPRAYVFVAEVALGQQHIAVQAEFMEQPREGTHSTLAPGEYEPNPALSVTLDETGDIVPLGSVRKTQLPQQYEWSRKVNRWHSETLEQHESNKIEKVLTDPNTKFPATVRVNFWNSDYVKSQYDVKLENGPFSSEAMAWEVAEHEDGDDKGEDSREDEPDMSAFKAKKQEKFKLERKPVRSSAKRHSEFIVYDTSQIRLAYLIELTSPQWVKRTWEKQECEK